MKEEHLECFDFILSRVLLFSSAWAVVLSIIWGLFAGFTIRMIIVSFLPFFLAVLVLFVYIFFVAYLTRRKSL